MRRLKPHLGCLATEGKEERNKYIVINFNTFSSMKRALPSVTGNKAKLWFPTLYIVLNPCVNFLDRFERLLCMCDF